MKFKEVLIKELVKKGYSELEDGRKVWDMSNRCLLYSTPELVSYFLKARSHPRYIKTVIEIETNLLKENAKKFTRGLLDNKFNLIDLGAVDGLKAKIFLQALDGEGDFRFCPASHNDTLAELSLKNIQSSKLKNVSDYSSQVFPAKHLIECIPKLRDKKYSRNFVLLLESALAAFEIHEFLFELSQSMIKGDVLIIGNGIRTGERFEHLETYKSSLFRNWFLPKMTELGFNEEDIEYDARFANGRVEGFFRIKKGLSVNSDNGKIIFRKGDEVIVAILYKYYEQELLKFCKMYFREVLLEKDKESEYALILCKK